MHTSTARQAVGSAGLLTAGCLTAYWCWLGWDHAYQTDAQTGIVSGPYEAWQILGCALTLAAVAITAGITRRAGLAISVMPLAFTVAWAIPASAQDETGLYGVGAILIFLGLLAATAVLAPASQLLSARLATR